MPAPFNFGEDFTLSEPKNHSEENMLVTVNNRQKDVVLDIAFNSTAITIFFIKPLGEKYTPFNGRTLKTLNKSFPDGISDHNPITVDIKL